MLQQMTRLLALTCVFLLTLINLGGLAPHEDAGSNLPGRGSAGNPGLPTVAEEKRSVATEPAAVAAGSVGVAEGQAGGVAESTVAVETISSVPFANLPRIVLKWPYVPICPQ